MDPPSIPAATSSRHTLNDLSYGDMLLLKVLHGAELGTDLLAYFVVDISISTVATFMQDCTQCICNNPPLNIVL